MSEALAVGSRGPYRNGVRRREQIVESATWAFGEFGYAGASIRTIAADVGVSPASLLQHFGSKEGLLEAVLEHWTRQSVGAMNPADVRGLDYLRCLHDLMQFHLEHRGLLELFVTMTAEASSPSHPARDFIQHRYADTLRQWSVALRQAAEDGDIRPLSDAEITVEARMLIAVADGLEVQWLLDPTVDLAGLFGDYLEGAIARWQQPLRSGEGATR